MKMKIALAALLGLPPLAGAAPQRFSAQQCENLEQSLLTCAAAKGRPKVVRSLLDAGTPVDERDALGATALHWAAKNDRLEVMQILLARKADVDARNKVGGTPLHWATKSDALAAVQLLLSREANANAVNGLGWTPLMMAADNGNVRVARALLDRKPDVRVVNSQGATAWSLAIKRGNRDIAHMLWEADNAAPSAATAETAGHQEPAAPAVGKAEVERMIAEAVRRADAKPAAAETRKSDVDSPRYNAKQNPNDYAVVIGIERYSDIPDAEFAEHDAAAVRAHLAALGYPERNMVSLTGSKATKTGLIKTLETWLPRNVNERSTVFVYYSGHGAPDVKSGRSYLVPWDGDPQFLEDTGYPVERLYQKLGELKAKHVLVALDACFSGVGGRSVLAKGMRPLVTQAAAASVPENVVALTASAANQAAGAFPGQAHGLFTYYLLRGLNGDAADENGRVTVASLYESLSTRVQDEARREGADQSPQIATGSTGEPLRLR